MFDEYSASDTEEYDDVVPIQPVGRMAHYPDALTLKEELEREKRDRSLAILIGIALAFVFFGLVFGLVGLLRGEHRDAIITPVPIKMGNGFSVVTSGAAPTWENVKLTTHVSERLPVGHAGTGDVGYVYSSGSLIYASGDINKKKEL